ncbi:MAG: cytochrome b/b6 domain-containing protein [Dehalococcoidia bacterium]|nr:cytochrome b/b6 domain-containing protein [Dehalococcoidia bacterium]
MTSAVKGDYVYRFSLNTRIQHAVLLVSFTLLVMTGLPIGFPEAPTAQWWIGIWGGKDNALLAHQVGAVIISLVCLYHLLSILFFMLVLKKPFPWDMAPKLKDAKDIMQSMLHVLGLAEEPKYNRFQYGQKIDYWSIFWGMPVMVITGFVMWFPDFVAGFLPQSVIPISVIAHRDEAILASSFILIVHMYYGHLAPITFPINWVMFSGRKLKAEYKNWFGLEYVKLMKEAGTPDAEAEAASKEVKVARPVPPFVKRFLEGKPIFEPKKKDSEAKKD